MIEVLIFVAAAVAGTLGAVAGFGIGTLLTPLLALTAGTKLAVALASLPHLIGSAARLWTLRHHIDKRILWSFGAVSAVGALAGAMLNRIANNPLLTLLLGALVLITGVSA